MKLFLFNFFGPEVLIVLIVLLPFVMAYIFYIRTLQKTLAELSDKNKSLPSWSIWLILLPVVGSLCLLYVVWKLSQSLALEFKDRGIESSNENTGLIIGMLMSLCFLLAVRSPIFGAIGVLFWIIHWVKMSKYKSVLRNTPIDNTPQFS